MFHSWFLKLLLLFCLFKIFLFLILISLEVSPLDKNNFDLDPFFEYFANVPPHPNTSSSG